MNTKQKAIIVLFLLGIAIQACFASLQVGTSPISGYPTPSGVAYSHSSERANLQSQGGSYPYDYDFSWYGTNPASDPYYSGYYAYHIATITEGPHTGFRIYILFTDYNPNYPLSLNSESITWINQNWYPRLIAGGYSGGGAGAGAGTADPIVGNTIRSFCSLIFSERVKPKEQQDEEENNETGQKRPKYVKPTDFNSDLQIESFSIASAGGNSITLRGNLERTLPIMDITIGGNLNINSLKFKGNDPFSNFYLGLFGKLPIMKSGSMTANVGGNLDIMIMDKDYIDDPGFGISMFGALKNSGTFPMLSDFLPGDHLTTVGGMLTITNVEKMTMFMLNGGASYGVPIAEKFTATMDIFGTYKFLALYDGESIDLDDRMMVNVGTYFGYHLSSLFELNLGLKTVLLAKDFSSVEIALGGSYRF